jgi:hypothetical protein
MIEGWLKLGRIKPTIDDLTGALTWTGADLFGRTRRSNSAGGEGSGWAGAMCRLRQGLPAPETGREARL